MAVSRSASVGFTGAAVPRILRESRGVCVRHACSVKSRRPLSTVRAEAGGKGGSEQTSGFYKHTVNLPSTKFDQRANAVTTEPRIQKFWEEERIYERLAAENPKDTFSIHDGPPYANGSIHMGHALNKILKDFINRHQLMRGRKARLIPGWDCHGLPIELKVLQSMKSKQRSGLTPLDLRKRARDFALEAVEGQMASFQRLGVWASWDDAYLTLKPEYEAAQIEVFGQMFLEGYIFRGKKPVHWSPSSRTALAEAELEYPEGHTSRSVYVAFPVVNAAESGNEVIQKYQEGLSVAIWTTTPWTLPANRAVAVNPALRYALVQHGDGHLVIASDLVETVLAKLGLEGAVVGEVLGSDLAGLEYTHPVEDGKTCTVIEGGDYITTESGTGLVHTAPGHGQEDYVTGLKVGLEILSPVDDAGKFTEEAANGKFTGLNVLSDGNEAVIQEISGKSLLLLEEAYAHKYPYDWRTKKPTIFRATEQWFASVEGFRDRALEAVGEVQWVPEAGGRRIYNMIEGRNDWCISRQRSWGVPIPVFYDPETGEPTLDEDVIGTVAEIFREKGSDAWWEMDADELLPEQHRGRGLRKGTDTMDVWFDSGSSWNGVTKARPSMQFPADLYLEGSDQHRGWFQSSLLTSVASEQVAPYKAVLTHGFVLDSKGMKMSKSVGNVVEPLSIVEGGKNKKQEPAYGADVLRLWVASVDFTSDVYIGDGIIKNVSDSYRKIRNTLRYLVANVNDFKPAAAVPFEEMPKLDRYILRRLASFVKEVEASYDAYSFLRVYQAVLRFAIVDLSNFYLDIAKDRLYISGPSDARRVSCQTVLAELLEAMALVIAPILPHTAEDLWGNVPWREEASVFQHGWVRLQDDWLTDAADEDAQIERLRTVRTDVNKCLDQARAAKRIGSGLSAKVVLFAEDEATANTIKEFTPARADGNDVDELRHYLIVSVVEVAADRAQVEGCEFCLQGEESGIWVGVDVASGGKCDRCWVHDDYVGSSEAHPLLCERCEHVVVGLGIHSTPVAELAQ